VTPLMRSGWMLAIGCFFTSASRRKGCWCSSNGEKYYTEPVRLAPCQTGGSPIDEHQHPSRWL